MQKLPIATEAETWIFTKEGADQEKAAALLAKGVQVILAPLDDEGLDLSFILNKLFEKGITDVLVEGGSEVNGAFLRAGSY